MAADHLMAFQARMREAERALLALEAVSTTSTVASISNAAAQAKRACDHLHQHQVTVRMTPQEADQIQTALERIRERMKFLGRTYSP